MVTVGDDPLLGMVVEGRYKIQSVIGQGSAGTVYKAVQELIGREVAIKVLHDYLVSDDEFIKRFTQEAKASSRLSHPNIITIYDFGVIPQGGRPYIAMDLLKGTPLSDLIQERNHLTMDESIPIFVQVCAALGEAHRQGVVHRDVKPENVVLVERSGQHFFPIVVDFGIARLVQEESDVARITRTGTVCGSPTYMSPEQCTSSKVDHRSDIYSLGVVIYETLTGEVPFQSDELVRVMAMHLSDPPKPLNSVRDDLRFPDMLEEVVYRALAKNPDQRYQSMDEFAEALEAAVKEPVAPPPAPTPPPVQSRPDIIPGPLASDESLQAKRATTSQEITQPPRVKTRDLASRALEELANRGGGDGDLQEQIRQYQASSAKADREHHEKMDQTKFTKGRGGGSDTQRQLLSIAKVGVPILAVFALAGGAWMYANNPGAAPKMPWSSGVEHAAVLVAEGKYEEGLQAYEDAEKKGELKGADLEKLNQLRINVAKSRAKDKKYAEAVAVLEDIPQGTSQFQAAKKLKDQYKAMIKKPKKPKKT